MEKEMWKAGNMVYPLPAVMVSCQREGEVPNILTVSWTGTICTDPAMVYVSIRPERFSYDIIKDTKEFVINLTTKDLVKQADYCGVKSGRDVNKFEEMKLTPEVSKKVSAPSIKESPVSIECKVKKIEKLGSHHMFIAEVLCVNVDKTYMDKKGKFELNKSNLITYSHGEYYTLGVNLGKFGFSINKKYNKSKGRSNPYGSKNKTVLEKNETIGKTKTNSRTNSKTTTNKNSGGIKKKTVNKNAKGRVSNKK